MARPAHERVGKAFRLAMEKAGLRQGDIAEALNVDPATVSRWSRGMQRIDLEVFPLLDELCGQRRGYLLELAGYVEQVKSTDVRSAIAADTVLTDKSKGALGLLYDVLSDQDAAAARRPAGTAHTGG